MVQIPSQKNPLWRRITDAFGTDDVQTIADALKISYQGVKKWKTGTAEPSRLRYEAISNLTNRSIDWLMTGKESLSEEERKAQRFDNLSIKFGSLTPAKQARAEVLIEMLEREIERMETEPDSEFNNAA
jgi:transcriptional regulator with XRE-family HTH domain